MTLGQFKDWCEEEGVSDDALLVLYGERNEAIGPENLYVEEEGLETYSDPNTDQEIVQINFDFLGE